MGVADGKVLSGDAALSPATDERIVDPTLADMQFTARPVPRSVLATLVNFASHPERLGSGNHVITADFPHAARARLVSVAPSPGRLHAAAHVPLARLARATSGLCSPGRSRP